ncbi:T6SS effector antibacterial DNase [Vibrio parahaemolyticus]|uniref:T6SS effector antibacterial DNase n=1 Tax=Vibrio parahaemolyticus TaxID=670 RepID=UPI0004DF72B1|nr:S-type pyocin domain-containing protein [Vibrio parahaemolyticus]HAS6101077.1 S-type Pyocin domain-containing protein [Vibrio vulnificus]HDL9486821.1 S-type pyocin domain-containing protein [Vibrio cholerae]MCX8800159.1 S-type pyocin domain-containing protein [Vibrio parahaemolyticus]MCX8825515.1 S-type pyocin domain-containing protein [Vibrio parahaemolyticus]MCX8928035.1 S-type pyocin domain-containing protein [Vibrio parahaemolyticus]
MDLTVGYRVVRLTELMTYEFGQVEGDIGRLDERALGSALPQGMSYSSFMEKLKSGELALLTDSPSKPVMLRDGMSKSWSLSAEGQEVLSPEAKNAYLSRTRMSGGAAGSATPTQSSAGYEPNIEETYVPEPVKPDTSDAPPKLQYEYCFEVACSDETFRKNVGYAFELAKTKQEALIGRWQTEATEHGTKYTAHAAFDEPKKLVAKVASNALGISVPGNVQVKPIGSGVVREAFIPVVPSVQLGERLGLPTEGYYYHFYNGRLVQEYKLLGNGKWAFYATRSTHEQLNDEQGYNIYQSAILVYWKLAGKDVENQHLIYLEQQITREELDNLNDDWLAQHGIKLDINELLAAPKQPVAERQTTQPAETEKAESKPETHTVGTDTKTNQRESWGAIAEQYGLSAKQLLDLNTQYNADPMSLKVGDTLTVKAVEQGQSTPEKATDLPPLSPCTYSCLANTHYDHSDSLISGTQFKAINSDSLFEKELPVTNLTTISTASKATDYGKTALLAIPANGAATNLGILSSSTTNTIGTWSISGEALAGFARMGGFLVAALWPSQLGDGTLDGNSDFAANDTTTMRVRFNMYTDENGKQQVVGIKTGEGSVYGERVAKREAVRQGQHFVAELENGITITWTPDGSTDVLTPDTVLPENDQLDVHNIWVRPIEEHEQEIGTALYPEEELAEYIVTFPADSGVSPLYLVFNKRSAGITKVKPLEVGTYGDLAPRSKKDGMDIDHIPSQAALLRAAEEMLGRPLTADEKKEIINSGAGVAIPREIHQKCSETYGGRNKLEKQQVDSGDLEAAVNSNFDAIKTCLKENGYTDEQLEDAREELHRLNKANGWY